MKQIRNFCIIAHIDAGKSTLADRFLELTGAVECGKHQEQALDTMELERERGITIKLQPATMIWLPNHGISNDKIQMSNQIRNPNDRNSKSLEIENCSPREALAKRGKLKIPDSKYILNLVDTPGHVDFSYEVSRSLAAVEGTILLVDATQGVQAQTLANYYLAKRAGLTIIPVINKIDLPNAQIEECEKQIRQLFFDSEAPSTARSVPVEKPASSIVENFDGSRLVPLSGTRSNNNFGRIYKISAKTGEGVEELLRAIVERVPAPAEDGENRALIFDSFYDPHQGVIAYARVFGGTIEKGKKARMMAAGEEFEVQEVGRLCLGQHPRDQLSAGEIGYVVTGLRDIERVRVGDTITLKSAPASKPLPGYQEPKPLVFAEIYLASGSDFGKLRDGIRKLKLNDASLQYELSSSGAFGQGFKLGVLGILHLEIVKERLEREFNLELVVTTPKVEYRRSKDIVRACREPASPPELPRQARDSESKNKMDWREPWAAVEIVASKDRMGPVMELAQSKRAIAGDIDYLGEQAILHYEMPLSEIIVDFYDQLKSVSAGYASLDYEFLEYRLTDLVGLDILLSGDKIDALSQLVYRPWAEKIARQRVVRLKELIPRQNFEVRIQAAVGSRILASERISPYRKDVTAKLYGGDVTRKRKLLDKQAKGKRRMAKLGKIEVPTSVFIDLLSAR